MRRALVLVAGLLLVGVTGTAGAQQSATQGDFADRAVHVCAACHGNEGISTTAKIPSLGGQQPLYTVQQLKLFRDQKRAEVDPQAYMWGVTALLDDSQIKMLADYYAEQKPPPAKRGDAKLTEQGRRIYAQGIPSKGVKPCGSCHGENGEGASVFPRLAGQHADYLLTQLKVFRTRLRPYAVVMAGEIKNMSVAEMRAVAVYLQGK